MKHHLHEFYDCGEYRWAESEIVEVCPRREVIQLSVGNFGRVSLLPALSHGRNSLNMFWIRTSSTSQVLHFYLRLGRSMTCERYEFPVIAETPGILGRFTRK